MQFFSYVYYWKWDYPSILKADIQAINNKRIGKMKILEYLILSVSLSVWGRPDDIGCRDKSDVVTVMVLDDSSNLVCPKNYPFFDLYAPKTDSRSTVEVTWEWFPCYKTGTFCERKSYKSPKILSTCLFAPLIHRYFSKG